MKCNKLISLVFLGVLILVGCGNSTEDIDKVVNEEVISEVEYREVTDEELDTIIEKGVQFLQAEPKTFLNADDSLGLYKEITGYHITENEEHYNLLKEAYWDEMEDDGLCHNGFWVNSNVDCTNKPDEAFARVEAYIEGNLITLLKQERESEYFIKGERPEQHQYSYYSLEEQQETVIVGLTYTNFLKVGDEEADTLSEINELFGFNGTLQTESDSYGTLIQSYEWHKGSGANYKIVSIWFVNGRVDSKSQVGL